MARICKKEKNLLVEDSRLIAKIVEDFFRKCGYETEIAVTGEDAVQKISGGSPLVSGGQEQVLFNTVHRRKDGILYPVEVNLQLYNEPKILKICVKSL